MVERPQTTDDAEPLEGDGADDTPRDDAAEGAAADAQPPVDVETLAARAAEADVLADRLKRVEAEFLNETRRIRRHAEQERKYAIETVVVDLLPVVDALESARGGLGDDEASAAMREGLALVQRQLDGIFQRHGVAAIEALGKPFDPARHQAMLMVERADVEPQTVCEVLRTGYELNGRVVRPAEVIVARAAVPAPETAGDDEASEED